LCCRKNALASKDNQVIATRLSHGGLLAAYAVSMANNVYQKLFIMNPSFAAMNPVFDCEFGACVNLQTTDCVNVILEKALEGLPDEEDDSSARGILAMILGIDNIIESLIEMFQEGMTFDNNTEEQKYSILQFMHGMMFIDNCCGRL
jgi:hypothetical protein